MSAWPGKFVIGLTGNIATGKSEVRRMLEKLGAFGIDADALAHQVIAENAPGYQPVLDAFGKEILNPGGQINRAKLGQIVFADPAALRKLEGIIHPLVGQALDSQVRNAIQSVIVIEAIKLIEAGLHLLCDQLWVINSSTEAQFFRLTTQRGMSDEMAAQRIEAQPSQKAKLDLADVVIQNNGSIEETWQQVSACWDISQANRDH
jgi:dephospho-CoA kinase